jgi:hypothetical protein
MYVMISRFRFVFAFCVAMYIQGCWYTYQILGKYLPIYSRGQKIIFFAGGSQLPVVEAGGATAREPLEVCALALAFGFLANANLLTGWITIFD